jgi:hypothetical protein
LYDRNPRDSWSAFMAYHFPGVAATPDRLMKLTPWQFDDLVAATTKLAADSRKNA